MQQPFTPAPLVPLGEADRVEVDLPRQVLLTYQGGKLVLISHISTGRSARWPTPGGLYHFTWRVSGWRTSELGRLYNPVYFNKGHRDPRRAERAQPARVARLRAHPHAHREVLPEPRGLG